jgi:2'-5' RNA ligase
MKKDASLYMFAIMPPSRISRTIHGKRVEFFQRYKFRKALKPPVHIALLDPFFIPQEYSGSFEKGISHIQDWASNQCPFGIDLHNYNFFDNPRQPVVFIDVVKSEQLANFHCRFTEQLAKYKIKTAGPRSYKPHVTIGYRDVDPGVFHEIKKYYSAQTFDSTFDCNNFYLWKYNGDNWQVIKTYTLSANETQLTLFSNS